jgi:hypothetical protein
MEYHLFIAGFYSKNVIFEMVSLDYVNFLGYFMLYFSMGFLSRMCN